MDALRQAATDRVAREDLVTFVNASFACTGQREFYGDSKGQAITIEFLHEYILGNYRRLYARTLAAGINHFNQAQVILNLLATGASCPPADRAEEGALIQAALARLPPQRALRVLAALGERRINNRRARAVARDYLRARRDPNFDALKYRRRVRQISRHAHLTNPGEIGTFLFEGFRHPSYRTELFERFRQAHYSASAIWELPASIAEGLAAKHEVDRGEFLERIGPRMTAGERLRAQGAAERGGARHAIDLGRVALTRLALYALGLSDDERRERRAELDAALARSAAQVLARAPTPLGRVAAVLDASYSASGSSEKRRRPLAVALGASYLLRAAATEYRAFWTPRQEDELALRPRGATDLATPLIVALEWRPALVVVVSDGFDNDPPRGAAEILRCFVHRLDPWGRTAVVHANPVFDADDFAPRTLGPDAPTVGLRNAEDLLTVLGFARFAAGRAPLGELEEYLAAKVRALLGGEEAQAQR